MTRTTIAQNLRRARHERGLTAGQVEIKTGMSHRLVYQYERGEALPGPINLAILCRAYRVSADTILGISE